MAKKNTTEKKPKVEWHDGWPDERGLYLCEVNGKQAILAHHCCGMNNKHWWTDTRGYDVVGYEVRWSGVKLTAAELK